jgi:glycosyltransferase involved in cell wall biosynthesis
MKVALIAPSPVPFVLGGAENLWTGLLGALNAQPGVEADLIKLPSPERTLSQILASYQRFAGLNLDHFDLVVSTKYPAWAVRHRNHLVYMQHKLRGLYDTYPAGLPVDIDSSALQRAGLSPALRQALAGGPVAGLEIGAVAEALQHALQNAAVPDEWAFPGPLSRACVHLLDRIALQPGRIARYAAISRVVASRADYFPAQVPVEVHHHPTGLCTTDAVAPTAIFTASRLDRAKRIDLIIQAYVQADLPLPLRIAGSGPDAERLQALAQGHPRIHFLGRLTDRELAGEYAQALFVPFVPYQEDYGLITVEAMQTGRALLTTTDAGGGAELVEHGKTGLVVAPDASVLAHAMRRLCDDQVATQAMGQRARERVAAITWDRLARELLQPHRAPTIATGRRPRYAVINTFPIAPVVSGGQIRLHGLYRYLARHADLYFVNLGPPQLPHHVRQLEPGLIEEIVPGTTGFAAAERRLSRRLDASVGDLAAALYPGLVPEWIRAIRAASLGCDGVICSHPYGYPALQEAGWGGAVYYEAHNVESLLKPAIYRNDEWAIDSIYRIEGACVRAARAIAACSDADAQQLKRLFDTGGKPLYTVPNGVDLEIVRHYPWRRRLAVRARLGMRRPLALFAGSAHHPNREAVRHIIDFAGRLPQFDFAILGSVCHAFKEEKLPSNVRLLGVVSIGAKELWMAAASIGLNPMESGSGTNLKIIEYAAAGLPIISTEFGARGGVLDHGDYIAADMGGFVDAMAAFLAMAPAGAEAMTERAYSRVRERADWRVIADAYACFLSS